MTRAPAPVCLVNIGPAGVARRRRTAVIAVGVAAVALAALVVTDVPHRWRALLVVPLWFGALCWLQAAART